MKKNYAFAFVALVLLATSLVFAQNSETVEKMTGVRGVALRTFCSFSTLFGADNTKCFDATKVGFGNTAAVGAAGIGSDSQTPSVPSTPTSPVTGGQTASIGGFTVPVAPQIVERTVIVQGTPGLQGPAGRDGQSATGAFTNVPQVFWNGGGGSSAPVATFVSSSLSFPTGGLPGQVLTLDASSTPVWMNPLFATTTSSTSSLAWLLGGNSAVGTSSIGTLDLEDFIMQTNSVERMRILGANGYIGIGTSTPMRPLTVEADVSGTLALFKNTRTSGAAGVSMIATRADGTESTRGGLFVYGQNNGDDRMGLHFIGHGDVQTWDKSGNTYIGAPLSAILAPVTAKLNVVGSIGTSSVMRVQAANNQISPILSFQTATGTERAWLDKDFDFHVPTETFGLTWLSSTEVPTKGDLYTQFQTFASTSLSVAGMQGQLQFNSGGMLGATSTLTWDETLGGLALGSNTSLIFPHYSPKLRVSGGDVLVSGGNYLVFDDINKKSGIVWQDGNTSFTNESSHALIQSVFGGSGGAEFTLRSNAIDTPENRLRFMSADSSGFSSIEGARVTSIFSSRGVGTLVGDLAFSTNNGTAITEKMRLTNEGKLGIGTTTPAWMLDVAGDASINGVRVGLGGGSILTNTVLGKEALMTNTTGQRNVASGYRSLLSNTEGHNNTAFGAQTLAFNTLGNSNVAVGISALFSNVTGNSNVAVGGSSLSKNQSGSHNVALGAQALDGILAGSGNIGIGYQAGSNITTGQNNIVLGYQVNAVDPIANGQLNIGNLIFSQGINATGTILSTGNIGIGVQAPARKLHVAITTSGQVARFQNADGACNINPSIFFAFNCLSDRNLKKDIAPLASSLALFAQLNPVNYHWNTEDSSSPLQYGFIAQDIEAIFPSFVTTDSETGIKSVAFGNLIPVTIKAVNEMNAHLGDLSKENVTGEEFAASTIFKRFADAFKAVTVAFKNITADKATVKELCLPKSDGTVICLSGDQVAAIVASAGVNVEPVVVETPKDDVDPIDSVVETAVGNVVPVDPVGDIKPMPVEDAPTGDTLTDVSESLADEAPVEAVQPEIVETAAQETSTVVQ